MIEDIPTTDERLARAANTSDLSVTPDRRGDGYTLIAAGKTPRVVGRHLMALHGEWDGCTKPRRIMEHDINAIVRAMPAERMRLMLSPKYLEGWPKMEPKLREQNARALARRWHEQEMLRAFARLKSLGRVRAGLMDIVGARIDDAAPKVLAVLAWWLDSVCPVCHGTKYQLMPGAQRLSERACEACHGTGERPLPYGSTGRLIEREINECLSRARQSIGNYRGNLLRGMG